MITWVVALLCSAAVGARLGRLTVRPPSLARVAIAVAAVAVTAAATVRTSTIGVLLDGHAEGLAATVFELCVVVFAATSALIAAASLTAFSRRPQWALAVASAVVAGAVAATELAESGHAPVTSVYLVAASLFAVAVSVRHIRWNPLGRAIGLYCAGLVVIAAGCAADLVSAPREHVDPSAWWWSLAVILVAAGCSSVMVEAWCRAQADLRRTRPLWSMLTGAHPELLDGDYRSVTATLTAEDRVSQILDGLYLHAGAGLVVSSSDGLPTDVAARAEAVARWLHHSWAEVEVVDPGLLGTPEGVTDRQWILAVCAAYGRPRRRAVGTVA